MRKRRSNGLGGDLSRFKRTKHAGAIVTKRGETGGGGERATAVKPAAIKTRPSLAPDGTKIPQTKLIIVPTFTQVKPLKFGK